MTSSKTAVSATTPLGTQSKPGKKASKSQNLDFPPLKSFELLGGLFTDDVGQAFRKFFKWYQKTSFLEGAPDKGKVDVERGLWLYRKLWKAVLESAELLNRPSVGNGLQDHFLERFLDDANILHRKAERALFHQIGLSLKEAYEKELELFLVLLRADWENLFKKKIGPSKGVSIPSLSGMKPVEATRQLSDSVRARFEIKEKILRESHSAPGLVPEICAHFLENGFGLFSHFRAFRWNPGAKALEGVEYADPIRLENLVGYDEQRQPLLDNIQGFVAGRQANNVLIYGERGTGKSSTVKALLNAYQRQGLRLVEIHPPDLQDFPALLRLLRGRQEKFILFVDDLSFEENENQYKSLKAVLEGSVEATPSNTILIATSNRRHLVPEYFNEREEGTRRDGEVHGQDTVEQKLSLSDRFGLVVSFYTPNQETYLKIVDSWAKWEGLKLASSELHSRALLWARQNNGPTGRAARQFVNDLKGKN